MLLKSCASGVTATGAGIFSSILEGRLVITVDAGVCSCDGVAGAALVLPQSCVDVVRILFMSACRSSASRWLESAVLTLGPATTVEGSVGVATTAGSSFARKGTAVFSWARYGTCTAGFR